MKITGCPLKVLFGFAVCVSATGIVCAQNAGTNGVPVHMVVTAEARHGSDVPEISQRDVMVNEGHDRDEVTSWIPAKGDNAALELFILLDDGSGINLGTQLDSLRKFIMAQPASTKVGIAYMQNGTAKVAQSPTGDHALAAKALRLPMGAGGANASPYFALSDLVKRWPESAARREVFMATDGIDLYYGGGDLQDPYLDAAIDDALRAGIIVYAIYTPGAGHVGHSYWQNYWGQMYLSRVADETGGESYYIGFTGGPVRFDPYLEDMENRLDHQYLLAFNAKPQKKNGWQRIKVTTEVPNAELVSAHRMWVPAAPQ
ncbi:MAG TPA: hypothetical protein VN911_14625 [Candidatus Acidoferrum sp.]|nr:hypothetical protein [Candidatus Acidoferrum sp.]